MSIEKLSVLDEQEAGSNTCIVLLRVSTKEQTEKHSLGAQKAAVDEYVAKNNLKIVKVFEFHESASKRKERVIFNTVVLPYIHKHNIKHVVVEKTDRLCRNFKDSGVLEDLVDNSDLSIHLVKENLRLHKNSSAHDKAVFGHKVLDGRNFACNLVEEIKKAYDQKVTQGLPPNNYPYGYRYNSKTQEVVINKDQAEVIRRIYSLFASGKYSLIEITDMLNKERIPSPSQDRQMAIQNNWTSTSVRNILQRPNYYGDFVHNGLRYKGKYELIITHKVYNQCATLLAKQRRKRRVTDENPHPYANRIFTSLLENNTGKRASLCYRSGDSPFYRVYFKQVGKSREDKTLSFTEQSIYESVDKAMMSFVWEETPEQRAHKIEQDIFAKKKELQKLRQETRDTMDRLREKRSSLIALYLDQAMSRQEFNEQRKIIAVKVREQNNKLKAFRFAKQERENYLSKIKHVHEFYNKHKLYLSAQSKEEKLAILKSLVASIIVEPDRKIKICLQPPYTFVASIYGYLIKASHYNKGRPQAVANLTNKQVIHHDQLVNQRVGSKPQNKIYHIFRSILSNKDQTPFVNKSFNST